MELYTYIIWPHIDVSVTDEHISCLVTASETNSPQEQMTRFQKLHKYPIIATIRTNYGERLTAIRIRITDCVGDDDDVKLFNYPSDFIIGYPDTSGDMALMLQYTGEDSKNDRISHFHFSISMQRPPQLSESCNASMEQNLAPVQLSSPRRPAALAVRNYLRSVLHDPSGNHNDVVSLLGEWFLVCLSSEWLQCMVRKVARLLLCVVSWLIQRICDVLS
jgi:hypothetical protein